MFSHKSEREGKGRERKEKSGRAENIINLGPLVMHAGGGKREEEGRGGQCVREEARSKEMLIQMMRRRMTMMMMTEWEIG